jgi:hypothetical protein
MENYFDENLQERLEKLNKQDPLLFKFVKNLLKQNQQLLQELEIIRGEKEGAMAIKKKRDPLTKDLYQALIDEIVGPGYLKARLRVAFLLLTVFGVTINNILEL